MRHRPLLLWTAAFLAGTAGRLSWPLPLRGAVMVAVCGLGLLLWPRAKWQAVAAGIALLGFAAGMWRAGAAQIVPAADVSHAAGQVGTLTATVLSDPEERRWGRLTFLAAPERWEGFRGPQAVTGMVYVSVAADARLPGSVLEYGSRVTLAGRLETPPSATNPGGFSWHDYLARRSIWSQMVVRRPGAVQRIGRSGLNPFLRLASAVRVRILRPLQRSLSPTQAAVLSGILLGKRTDLPPDLMADFVATGTVHLLASAGLHVGIVAWWLLAVLERLTLPRKLSALLIILALWLYALMAGGRPAVLRAVTMATLWFGAIVLEREPDLPTTLAAAALLIALAQPTALLEPGFQLSFLTVLTLAAAMPLWERFGLAVGERKERGVENPSLERRPHGRGKMPNANGLSVRQDTFLARGFQPLAFLRFLAPVYSRLWTLLGLALFAQIGSAPIIAADYNEVSLSGLLANLLTVPALFLLIPLGLLGALMGSLWPPLGTLFLVPAGWVLTYVVAVVRFCGEGAWSVRAIVSPTPLQIALYYAAVYGGIYALRLRFRAPLDEVLS